MDLTALYQFIIIIIIEILFLKKGVKLDEGPRKLKLGFQPPESMQEKDKNEPLSEYEQKLQNLEQYQKQMQQLSYEAEKLNNPATFAQHSKILRKQTKLQQEIDDLKQWLSQNQHQKPQPKKLSEEERARIHKEQVQEKLDIKDASGLWRNARILAPLILGQIFKIFFKPIEIAMSSYYLYPIGNIFGSYSEETQIYTLGNFFWTIACFRIVSSSIKLIQGKK